MAKSLLSNTMHSISQVSRGKKKTSILLLNSAGLFFSLRLIFILRLKISQFKIQLSDHVFVLLIGQTLVRCHLLEIKHLQQSRLGLAWSENVNCCGSISITTIPADRKRRKRKDKVSAKVFHVREVSPTFSSSSPPSNKHTPIVFTPHFTSFD